MVKFADVEKDGARGSLDTLEDDVPAVLSLRRSPAIQLPPSKPESRIPIGYRTLSIHVYDSQRFDPHTDPKQSLPSAPSHKAWQFWKCKTTDGSAEDDATFFGKLDLHAITPHIVCQRMSVAPAVGLDSEAAARRLKRNGPNVLAHAKPRFWRKIARYVFGDFCSILWIGVIIFFISWKPLGDPPAPYNLALAIVVILVIIMQATFSGFQDWSAQRVMSSILTLLPETAVVIRDGSQKSIPSTELVVGDIVELRSGQKVPADIRIIKASNDLRFDRAVLTGEAEEVTGTVDTDETNFLEAKNIALLGTHVCNGSATGVVVLTGSRTAMGRISKLTSQSVDERTNLQREITRFVKIIIGLTVSLIIIMLVTWLAWLRVYHYDFLNTVGILTNLMALVVAFIPEGMPMAVALTLSLIARRMRDVNVLPKSLSTVETLGCVNVVCSDKTGTLTENKMSIVDLAFVDGAFTPGDEESSKAFGEVRKCMTLCNDAFFSNEAPPDTKSDTSVTTIAIEDKGDITKLDARKVQGNATDAALLRFTSALPGSLPAYKRVFDLPFNSRNKFALTYITAPWGAREIIVKGAPDILLPRCTSYLSVDGTIHSLGDEARATVQRMQEAWSRRGERVIILTQRAFTTTHAPGTVDFEEAVEAAAASGLVIVGLVGILDPPRSDIPHTVKEVRRSGSRFFMVTGDFYLTAVAIAQQIGIITGQREPDRIADLDRLGRPAQIVTLTGPADFIPASLVVEGKELSDLTTEQWDVVCKYEEVVFARTTPEQKLRIVTELRERGCVVAVTGDGVNDAPALKAADVGIALVDGSEVALEAADLVLMGQFSSIIEGIRLGRLVFQNLQKAISYLLPAGSFSEDWPVILNVFFGCPLPLSAFLMVIICCFTDLASCVTLIFEKAEFDLLTLPPRDPKKSHLVNLKIYLQSYGFIGVMETFTAHAMFFYYMWSYAGIPINKMFFAFSHYSDGYYGHTQAELDNFLNTGQCVYFVTLVILQVANLNSVRNKRKSIFQRGPQHNPYIFVGHAVSIAIAIFVTEVPGIQRLFGTASVPIKHWLLPIPLAVGLLAMDEIRKLAVRSWPNSPIAKVAW